jgi:WhiB family transcriptional regulator, redox-sensing transcriptional regulator
MTVTLRPRRVIRWPCQREDPELWFSDMPAGLELAKTYCQSCPVRAACLAGALQRREPHGVWGGEIFIDGVVVARKRPRGRPRKHPVMV